MINHNTQPVTNVKMRTLALATLWGAVWAAFLQFTRTGRWLAVRRTWITVVVGIGVDVLIALREIPLAHVLKLFYVLAASSIFIIARSLANELHDQEARNAVIRSRR